MMRPPEPSSAIVDEEKSQPEVKVMNLNSMLDEDDLESVEDYEEKTIYVRTKKVGYLIGTSGRTIRGFETNSGAKIDILKPNSCANETPILLSGTSESVRNVLRMIIDLYHMNNLSSELWQHLRRNKAEDGNSSNEMKIYGNEEIHVNASFGIYLQKLIPQLEEEFKVHIEIGKEQEDQPGIVPIGVIGTACQNHQALQKIQELYEKYLDVDVIVENNNSDHRLDPFSTCEESNTIRSTSSLSEFHNFNETVLISNMTEVNQALLQPICKLNSVMMETLKQEDGTFEVVISGSEINVKRAKLQLEHCIS